MKDVTLFIAHPDDEALFCWPMLDGARRIVCASSDAHNQARAWCRARGECLREVGALLGCEVVIFDHDSEFYRMETRGGALKNAVEQFGKQLWDAETIFTHNPWGEYGNIDHMLCHYEARTVQAQTKCNLIVSDIAHEINWLPVRPWALMNAEVSGRAARSPLVQSVHETFRWQMDRKLFDRIKAIYDARGCWTWAWEPVERCRLYAI